MPNLPTPGGSAGTWADDLNDTITVGHNNDGTHKSAAITSALGYTPVNKAGDSGLGAISLGSNNLTAGAAILGTNPASAGTLRLPNAGWIAARNQTNGADLNLLRLDTSNKVEFGTTVSDIILAGKARYDVRGYGAVGDGSTNDTAAIQAAIDAAKAAGGGMVYVPTAVYVVNGTLDMRDAANVQLVGVSGSRNVYGADPATGAVFKRLSGTGTMLRMGVTTGLANSLDAGGQKLAGIVLLCNDLAATGILVESMWGSEISDVMVKNATSVGVDITTIDLSGVEDTQNCTFRNLTVSLGSTASASAIGMRLGSFATGGGNTSINHFEQIKIYHKNGVGFQMGDSDTNEIVSMSINQVSGGSGIGVELKGSSTGGSGHCRHNHFGLLEPGPGGLTSRGTALTQPAVSNVISGYSRGNSSPAPTVETGSVLTWRETTGADTIGTSLTVPIVTFNGGTTALNVSGSYSAAMAVSGSFSGIPFDFQGGTFSSSAVIRLPNNKAISARNNANSADVQLVLVNTLDEVQFTTTIRTANITVGGGSNIALSTSTGTKIGTGTTQLLGFYNATPIAQRSGAAQAAVATTSATQTTPWGFSTQAQADAIVTLVNELRAWAVAQGFIKGSA